MTSFKIAGKRMWNTVLSVVLFAGGLYAILVILVMILQSHLVYFPHPDISITPDRVGFKYKEVNVTASDGVTINGWFIPSETPRGTVLFCHGNAGNISHRLESIEIFNKLNLNVLIFDYRGYGISGGKPSEQGTYLDAEAMLGYLKAELNIETDELIYFGRSLGGAIASRLAIKNPPAILIVESAFTSISDIGSEVYPFFPVRLISRFKYDTAQHLKDIHCPVLIVHSNEDEIIPFNHGQKLYHTANEPKQFLVLSGGHNEGFLISGQRYREGLKTFIDEYFGGSEQE